MAKIYRIHNTQDTKIDNYLSFDEIDKHQNKYPSTYIGILNVFKEAFNLIDMAKIIKK